jgi:hypothetical protein
LATRQSNKNIVVRWPLDQLQGKYKICVCGDAKKWWQQKQFGSASLRVTLPFSSIENLLQRHRRVTRKHYKK